jgi:hypothetical protein
MAARRKRRNAGHGTRGASQHARYTVATTPQEATVFTWTDFEAAAPELAAIGRTCIERSGLVLMGTIRRDGTPRISPCEVGFFEDQLLFGGMWRSKKHLDVLRDPRCLLHSTVCDKDGSEGEFKLRGLAVAMDAKFRERAAEDARKVHGQRPPEPHHLFALDIEDATYIHYPEGPAAMLRWVRPG